MELKKRCDYCNYGLEVIGMITNTEDILYQCAHCKMVFLADEKQSHEANSCLEKEGSTESSKIET